MLYPPRKWENNPEGDSEMVRIETIPLDTLYMPGGQDAIFLVSETGCPSRYWEPGGSCLVLQGAGLQQKAPGVGLLQS